MYNKIAFTEIGAVVATCQAEEGVEAGKLVKISDSGTVAPCQAGDKFCGVAMQPRNGLVAVQFKGFVTVGYSQTISLGWNTVTSNSIGGITVSDQGISVLVVSKNDDGTVDICL